MICLLDTSVFCNILRVPGRDQEHQAILEEFRVLLNDGARFFLPSATVIETGNHIGQVNDGALRRNAAERFQRAVLGALDGKAPYVLLEPITRDTLQDCLADFPDYAMRGLGLGDRTIIYDFERLCVLHPARRVFIWSLDNEHLGGYDRPPQLGMAP